MTSSLERGRAAFARQAWAQACEALSVAAESLDVDDQERLAVSAYMIGADSQCEQAWEAAHRAAIDAGDPADAARCAFWLALSLLLRGQGAQAGGWLSRAEALIDDAGIECAASGYLLIPKLLGALDRGDASGALDLAVRILGLARRFDDADLRALGMLGHGQALIASGAAAAGTTRLDEVMVSVTAGEVGPVTSGIVYCAVLLECMALFDLPRAVEWTAALTAWCDRQPDLVPYRGQCLVHRSQLQMVAGDWPEAITTAEAACRRLTDPPHPALGLAYYQEAELHRLVGAFAEAEAGYGRASRTGHDPMPGLALLALDRGDASAAATTIRRALKESRSPALLAAAGDILRSVGDIVAARTAADELAALARSAPSPVLGAMAAHGVGAVLVAEGETVAGLAELRAAARAWQSLHMPYEAARTAVVLGVACAAMGDRTSADLELANARSAFGELGARGDLDRLAALRGGRPAATPDAAGLSMREREVLGHLAAGMTNREIAAELHISQHTVGRHVENIFAKLGVTTRAAAVAHAYEHELLIRPR